MAPIADAVRFVDDKERRLGIPNLLQDRLVGELLGRKEEELEFSARQAFQRIVPLGLAERRVQDGGASEARLVDRFELVTLECDERGDDDGRAFDLEPGKLVDRRLSEAGGEHCERVSAVQDGIDCLGLARAEALIAERVAGYFAEPKFPAASTLSGRDGHKEECGEEGWGPLWVPGGRDVKVLSTAHHGFRTQPLSAKPASLVGQSRFPAPARRMV